TPPTIPGTTTFTVTASKVYVDDDWAGFTAGQSIADADPLTAGNQQANFGFDAFATVQNGIDAVATSGTVIVNTGTYSEAVTLANSKTVKLAGNITINSSASSLSVKGTFDLNGFNLAVNALSVTNS